MDQIKHLNKELVRDWLRQRQAKRSPLPDIDQIRRELGWKLLAQQVGKRQR